MSNREDVEEMKRKVTTLLMVLVSPSFNLVLIAQPVMVRAQDNQQPAQQAEQQSNDAYEYVAQVDDSYSVLARKAVQTYGLENKVNLSLAQIIAAETNLTLDASSPLLNEGEKVSFDKTAVKAAVDEAGKLSKTQQALWQPYTVGVDFDTRNNGE